jgi:predicted phosphodiesterase
MAVSLQASVHLVGRHVARSFRRNRVTLAATGLSLLLVTTSGYAGNALSSLKRAAPIHVVAPEVGVSGPAEPPLDLIEARKTWGTSAQITALHRAQPTPKATFSFAVIGDGEGGRFPWQRPWAPKDAYKKQLRAIHAAGPDLIVQLGDFVSKGTAANYRAYVAFLRGAVTLPMLHIIGNHDRSKPNGDADKVMYSALFGTPTDYALDYNGWRFIALDTSDYKLQPAQLRWLEQQLRGSDQALIFTHIVPKYLKGKIKSRGVGAAGIIPKAYFEEGSAEFARLVKTYKVRRVYMGHIHAYGTADVDGIKYVLSGGGGSPLYPLPPGYPKRKKAHYLLITADSQGLRETVHELGGNSFPVVFN